MTNRLALLTHWSVRQKLHHIVSSVQFSYVAIDPTRFNEAQ